MKNTPQKATMLQCCCSMYQELIPKRNVDHTWFKVNPGDSFKGTKCVPVADEVYVPHQQVGHGTTLMKI